jgi:hypothetical protein
MASKFLLTMKLTKQGHVKGSSTKKEGDLDFSKGMECHGFNYEVVTQFDAGSGQPVGKRQHGPITTGPRRHQQTDHYQTRGGFSIAQASPGPGHK